jgi:copper chaperone CopZ
MKRFTLILAIASLAATAFAKDIKTLVVTTDPIMHCNSCEVNIKKNLRFEKGVKKIVTNLQEQTVTVTYDADKTTAEALINAFPTFGYTATPIPADSLATPASARN